MAGVSKLHHVFSEVLRSRFGIKGATKKSCADHGAGMNGNRGTKWIVEWYLINMKRILGTKSPTWIYVDAAS